MRVRDLASKKIVEVGPQQSLREASAAMWENKIGSVVIQEDGTLVGILTERDVLKAMATSVDPDKTPVSKLMSSEVVTVGPDWEIYEAAAEMSARRIRHLVLFEDQKVIGVLSIRDVLLAGQRIEFGDGGWALLKDPLSFSMRERRVLHRHLQKLRDSERDGTEVDDLIRLLVSEWSLEENGSSTQSAIPEPAHEALRKAVMRELPALQRAVHPAPGWRRRR
ncbi:MAG: CBS domain-containing protein [Actinobacteria bacterium]|nr:CBS domain-containing protein [Actinomycetota bacterium]